jgi:hypothetical protein
MPLSRCNGDTNEATTPYGAVLMLPMWLAVLV